MLAVELGCANCVFAQSALQLTASNCQVLKVEEHGSVSFLRSLFLRLGGLDILLLFVRCRLFVRFLFFCGLFLLLFCVGASLRGGLISSILLLGLVLCLLPLLFFEHVPYHDILCFFLLRECPLVGRLAGDCLNL